MYLKYRFLIFILIGFIFVGYSKYGINTQTSSNTINVSNPLTIANNLLKTI
jgi:hypothetical protein